MTLGSAIKLARTAAGVKQRALAKKLRITPNYLSLLEAGRREPSIALLTRLAKALGVPTGIFFMWQEVESEGGTKDPLNRIRELLARLEALYLLAQRQKPHSKRRAA